MNEEGLKQLARKKRKIPDWSWDYLVDKGFVGEAVDMPFEEEAVEYILKMFDEVAAASPWRGGRRQTPDQERDAVPVSLSGPERERTAALEEYAANRAACDDGVRWFRERVLGGRLLTAGQARELIRSPAARFLEANTFEFAGGDVPLVGHRATLERYERGESGRDWEVQHRATVTVDPPGITETVELNLIDEALQLAPNRPRFRDGTGGQALYFVNERGRPRKVSVWDRSLLEQLRGLSEELVHEYHWELAHAAMFVLTGGIPAVPVLKVTTSLKFHKEFLEAESTSPEYTDAKIIIEATPWVSSETVRKHYRKAKIKLMGTSGGKAPGLKHLRLFRFVTERVEPTCTRGSARMPNGKSLVREWNEANPQWKAYKDTRRFWRDYNRIKRTIAVGPPYQTHHAGSDRRLRQTDESGSP